MRGRSLQASLVLLAWFSFVLACDTADRPRVTLETAKGEVSFYVDVADDAFKRRTGLMRRTELKADQGMFFIFPSLSLSPFWMKDTPLSLDIIFIGDDYRVLYIARQTEPYSETLIAPPRPYHYVLEVLAGTAERIGLHIGDLTHFQP